MFLKSPYDNFRNPVLRYINLLLLEICVNDLVRPNTKRSRHREDLQINRLDAALSKRSGGEPRAVQPSATVTKSKLCQVLGSCSSTWTAEDLCRG
jgi:hypothetical protein